MALRYRLELIALARGRRHAAGFMLSDVRTDAEQAGLLTGEEGSPMANGKMMAPRALAWLGTLLPELARRGLVEKVTMNGRVQYGQSDGARAHGNKQVIWWLTDRGGRVAELMSDGRHRCTLEEAESVVRRQLEAKEPHAGGQHSATPARHGHGAMGR